MEKGYIDTSQLSTPPENHELETAKFFADLGKNIIFINPINIKGTHTPDIIMDGVEWEIKSLDIFRKYSITLIDSSHYWNWWRPGSIIFSRAASRNIRCSM